MAITTSYSFDLKNPSVPIIGLSRSDTLGLSDDRIITLALSGGGGTTPHTHLTFTNASATGGFPQNIDISDFFGSSLAQMTNGNIVLAGDRYISGSHHNFFIYTPSGTAVTPSPIQYSSVVGDARAEVAALKGPGGFVIAYQDNFDIELQFFDQAGVSLSQVTMDSTIPQDQDFLL